MLNIKGFIETSFIDWEGRICAVVFLGGCNFACPFCHNAGLIPHSSQLPSIDKSTVLAKLNEKRNWIDGVVVSGGEPCLQQGIIDFVKEIKKMGFSVKLDTNGSRPETLKALITQNLIDYVAMDIKAPLTEHYQKLSGKDFVVEAVKQSIALILGAKNIDYEFRTTLVPEMLTKDDLVTIASGLQGSKRYIIQQFNPKETLDTSLQAKKPYPANYINDAITECKKYIPNTYSRQ